MDKYRVFRIFHIFDYKEKLRLRKYGIKIKRIVIDKLREAYPNELFETVIHRATEATESTNKHRSLCLYKNRLGDEYKALAAEIIERV